MSDLHEHDAMFHGEQFEDFERDFKKVRRTGTAFLSTALAAALLYLLVYAVIIGGVIYVAVHFIRKFW